MREDLRMSSSNTKCVICDSTDQWASVDQYRLKPVNMCICMKCGFITYPDKIAKSEDLKEFYRAEYRDQPSVENVFTGQRKLHYHQEFLGPILKQWKGRDPAEHQSPDHDPDRQTDLLQGRHGRTVATR